MKLMKLDKIEHKETVALTIMSTEDGSFVHGSWNSIDEAAQGMANLFKDHKDSYGVVFMWIDGRSTYNEFEAGKFVEDPINIAMHLKRIAYAQLGWTGSRRLSDKERNAFYMLPREEQNVWYRQVRRMFPIEGEDDDGNTKTKS